MKIFHVFWPCGAWLLVSALHGCAATIPETDDSGLNYFQQVKMHLAYASAEELVEKGQATEAADELWKIAPEFPQPTQQEIQMHAVAVLNENRHALRAYRYLKTIDEGPMSTELLLKKRLAAAGFYKQSRQAEKIIKALPRRLIGYGSRDEQIKALSLTAYAQFELDDLPAGVQTSLAIDAKLQGEEKKRNLERLWHTMLSSDPDRLQFYSGREQDEMVRPWIQLALLATPKEIDRERLLRQFRQWAEDHPQWPLPASAEQTLRARWNYLDFQPKKIVMLLPLSGSYAKVGRAVLAGFIHAHERQSSPVLRHGTDAADGFIRAHERQSSPRDWSIETYNTDQKENVYALYQRAVRERADVLIGPILKHKLASLTKRGALEIPVIALNYLRDAKTQVSGEFFQFGLLPEDEAKQLARRLWSDEHRSIVALSSNNAWGRRIYKTFAEEYESLGGSIREVHYYNPKYVDYSNVIRPLFRLGESRERINALERLLLGTQVSYRPGLRDDVSAVALFSNHKEAVLIYPQLKYHYVDRLPIYSTSHAYRPKPGKQDKRDLQGLIYCDIPFIVYQRPDSWPELKEISPEYWRLYAMGADAYTLAQAFRRMDISGLNVDGLTGTLSMDDHRRLFRVLPWAKLSARGMPLPLDSVSP